MNNGLVRIKGLAGAFTGDGFTPKQGRRPQPDDGAYIEGPLDILCNRATGTIVEIAPRPRSRFRAEGDIDGSGLVATAGFIDSHTHAIFAGDRTPEFFQRWAGSSYAQISASGGGINRTVAQTNASADEVLLESTTEHLRRMLENGATVVEVKSGYADSAEGELRLLRLIKRLRQDPDLPELRPTFLALHALPKGASEARYVDTMIQALDTVVAESLADHADAFPEQGFFSLSESVRFAKAARARGLRLKIHADEITDMDAARTFENLGALSVDHLQCICQDGVNALAQGGTVATLLPATSFYLGLPYADGRRLIDAGVRVALATDYNPGTAPEARFTFTNLLAASHLKMTATEILCACTCNAAGALGLDSTHGTLTPGKRANLLLWELHEYTGGNYSERLLERLLFEQKPRHVLRLGQA